MAKTATKKAIKHKRRECLPLAGVRAGRSRMGRSTVFVTCPFCEVETECFTWSIHGSGKRCECGAILGGYMAMREV